MEKKKSKTYHEAEWVAPAWFGKEGMDTIEWSGATFALSAEQFQQYVPEKMIVLKDDVMLAIEALKAGLDVLTEAAAHHELALGRATRKNAAIARQYEVDIDNTKRALENLQNHLKNR